MGVAAGVASLIVALAITNGMRRDLQDRLLGSTSHVSLMRASADGIRNWRPLLERLRRLNHVKAAAPGLYGQVLLSRGARSGGALIEGVLPEDQIKVGDLLQSIKEGSATELAPRAAELESDVKKESAPPLVVGSELAADVGAKVGDTVLVQALKAS